MTYLHCNLQKALYTTVKLNLTQIRHLPIGDLFTDGDIIGSTASATSSKVIIKIYRKDPKDEPTPINADKYTVWIGLPSYLNISQMIVSGSTSNDDSLSRYANDHVYLVKKKPDDDHWLEELPGEVYAVLSNEND